MHYNKYPHNTKKWKRLQKIRRKLLQDFVKNRRKILKYTRFLNSMDASLSGQMLRIQEISIAARIFIPSKNRG